MYHKFQFNDNFHSFLIKIDTDFIEKAKKEDCPYCGGVLNRSDYERSPMGIPKEHRQYYATRFSLCCRTCRKRTTTPSVRFFGRRWYPAHLLICIFHQGFNKRCLHLLKKHYGIVVNKHTWKRWRKWWCETFSTTKFWQSAKGQLSPKALNGQYPLNIFTQFSGYFAKRVVMLLQFLSPMTAGNLRAV
jgi:hypothetical protein